MISIIDSRAVSASIELFSLAIEEAMCTKPLHLAYTTVKDMYEDAYTVLTTCNLLTAYFPEEILISYSRCIINLSTANI